MQYIGFMMNANEYSIPILKVQEIVNVPAVTKLPQAPHYIEGITNLRGRIIPVVNLKKLVGLPGEGGDKVIVISSGKITFGILIDSITGVVSIEDSLIEPAENFMQSNIEQIEGVARVDNKLVVLLDTKKLIPLEDMSMFEDQVFDYKEISDGEKVEVIKKIEGVGGEVMVKEVIDAKEFFQQKGLSASDPKYQIVEQLLEFMGAVNAQDMEKADSAIQEIMKSGQSDLFKEVGRITRKLHDSIRSFKEALDPKLKDMAVIEMPNAVDKLQFVITKTEEAANKTMEIVETHILSMDELAGHIRTLQGPEESVAYLKDFKNRFEDNLTEILTTQSFQDITGQTIKKVIKLVGDIEEELVSMITTFGFKMDSIAKGATSEAEKVSQSDVDDLLKELGF
ncbi:MAG: protein phosphatase CheZ [Dissulfurispiraceae bacterium]|jgi:chemotaxis protein CheZ|nr:protein phosphatase CheZ [Dissulfurispiraceae bacterium]